jgi:hypothetical protein
MVHFSIEMDIAGVSSLLSDILEPLLTLLQREVKDINFKEKCIPEIRRKAQPVKEFSQQMYYETEKRIAKLLQSFNGQKVSGILFGVTGEVHLPKFTKVPFTEANRDIGVDLIGEGDNQIWLVEIKFGRPNIDSYHQVLSRLKIAQERYPGSQAWLVVMNEVSRIPIIKEHGILFSSIKEVEQLEKILSVTP